MPSRCPPRRNRRQGPTKLRLLDLPVLVQEKILRRVDPFDVVSLSLCSSRTAKTINSVTLPKLKELKGPLTGGGVQVEFAKDHVSVVFKTRIPKCAMRVRVSEQAEHSENLICSSKFREGRKYDDRWNQHVLEETHWVADYSPSQFNEAAKRAVEHICSIFRLPVIRVSVNVHEIPNFSSLFIWDLLRGSCPDVQLHGYKRYFRFEGDVLNSEVTKFFRKVRVEKGLALEVENSGNMYHKFSKLRNLDLLVLQNASWMKDHHFKQLNCQFLEVYKTQITAEAINEWLTKWMNSSDTKTKVLTVSAKEHSVYNHRSIFKGLTHATHWEQRGSKYRKFGSFTRHFYREAGPRVMIPHQRVFTLTRADGAVATIALDSVMCVYMVYNGNDEDEDEKGVVEQEDDYEDDYEDEEIEEDEEEEEEEDEQ